MNVTVIPLNPNSNSRSNEIAPQKILKTLLILSPVGLVISFVSRSDPDVNYWWFDKSSMSVSVPLLWIVLMKTSPQNELPTFQLRTRLRVTTHDEPELRIILSLPLPIDTIPL